MRTETKKLTLSAIMIAMGTVLSFVRIYQLPLGGSVTLLSMLPICMIALCYGTKWGLFCAGVYAFLQIGVDAGQLMAYGMTPLTWIGCLVFDYILAFGSLGLAGIFRKKGTMGMCAGIAFSMVIRFLSHFISGAVVFAALTPDDWNIYLYSLCYNGSYMLPELVFTGVGAVLLFRLKSVKRLMMHS